MPNKKIGIIGLGKLGFCLADVMWKHFGNVIGIDLKEVEPPNEPWIENKFYRSTNFSDLKDREIIFCVVPTPSLKNGDFTNEYVIRAIKRAKEYMQKCRIFVLVSTVMPGSCRKIKRHLGKIKLVYNPEFIRLGDVVEGIERPDFVLIGEEDKESGREIKRIYRKICGVWTPIKRMDWKSAELTKLSLNSYVTMKISFANVIGEISKKLGTDAEKILDAIGEDSRIGQKYFKSGGAYGGPCFPRDNKAFSRVAGKILNYSELTDKINKHIAKEVGYFDKRESYQNVL